MKLKGLKLTQDEVSQEFDLNKILGVDISGDEGLQESIGQFIIDKIVSRTESGKSVDGGGFAKYSKSYKDSLEFKAFGKTSKVNMTLTGDMLSSLTVTSVKNGKIKVGWEDSENNAKAYGNITGMAGHPTLDGVTPKREFFGLTDADVKEIRDQFRPSFTSDAQDQTILDKIAKLVG